MRLRLGARRRSRAAARSRELLCFVLPPEAERTAVLEYLELLRARLEPHAGVPLERVKWYEGFGLSWTS